MEACPICQEDFDGMPCDRTLVILDKCQTPHVFCQECLSTDWAGRATECPLCRVKYAGLRTVASVHIMTAAELCLELTQVTRGSGATTGLTKSSDGTAE